MDRKKSLNLTVPAELAERFDAICKQYGHGKQKGVVLSAAILMYLSADPEKQGECLREVIKAEISAGVDRMIRQAQADRERRQSSSDDLSDADDVPGDPG